MLDLVIPSFLTGTNANWSTLYLPLALSYLQCHMGELHSN